MKKNILLIIALLVATGALVFSIITTAGISSRLAELTRANEALTTQVEELSARMDSFFVESAVTGAEDWSLIPTAWADGNGADVALSMTPIEYSDSMTVRFVVQMDQQPMADVVCDWNGTAYTATVGLPAMNGYSYSCVFDGPAETYTQVLTSPEAPTVWAAVYMEDALNHYCDLWLDSWTYADNTLTITNALVQIQLAQLQSADTPLAAQPEAALVLTHNGQAIHQSGVELVPGEGSGSYEATLSTLSLPLPELSEVDSVALWLKVACGSETMSHCAAEWYREGSQLMLAAG